MLNRVLLTILAIPVGLAVGYVLAIPVVGAPHSVPGLLLRAPEPVRNAAGLACLIVTPCILVLLIWVRRPRD